MRDARERLRDIQEAVARIERYAVQGRAAFDRDELIQTWIVHHLQVIGEAATALPADVRDRAATIPWPRSSVCAIFWCITTLRSIVMWSGVLSSRICLIYSVPLRLS